MYEVQFAIDETRVNDAFRKARISTDGISPSDTSNKVIQCIGDAPASSMGFNPRYDPGARGPTPGVSAFTPLRLSLQFPGYIVKGTTDASRYYLTQQDITLFERLAKMYARRSDLGIEMTMSIEIRNLLEENETSEVETLSADKMYSSVIKYPRCVIFEAGGNNNGYVVGFDSLTRPNETRIDHYDGAADGGGGGGGGTFP